MKTSITITENGPYVLEGDVPIAHQHIVPNDAGESIEWREGAAVRHGARTELCRCGKSRTRPFCDGSHERNGFDGTETASREPFAAQAGRVEGPELDLDDAERLCAFARFCDPEGQVWSLVQKPGAHARKLAEREAGLCPSGRLVARVHGSAHALEPALPPSLGLVQDTVQKVSGPIWVRGGIAVVAADGFHYEVRHRVTLCRCGASSNKPFCDGSHASIGWKDGTKDAP